MALWEDTLNKLRAGDTHALARRLDWVLKKTILERVLERQPQLKWRSPQIKHLDQLYSSLEPSEGLFWAYAQNDFVERAVDESRIDWFIHNPPADTRAWTRAMILRRTPPESLDAIDWDSIRIKTNGTGYWSRYVELDMSDPLGFTKEEASRVFREETVLENILESLAANRSDNAENGPQGSERGGDAPVPAQRRITH
jgi:proteasome accessory factor A